MAENPGIVVKSPAEAAAIAMMVIFFALLGTAIAVVAVFCSKRSLDKEFQRADKIRLRTMRRPFSQTGSSGKVDSAVSGDDVELLPRFQPRETSNRSTIRGRRGMTELGVELPGRSEGTLPQRPVPAYRREAGRVAFPGTKYGMGQIGNDGKVHRPESIFEYLDA